MYESKIRIKTQTETFDIVPTKSINSYLGEKFCSKFCSDNFEGRKFHLFSFTQSLHKQQQQQQHQQQHDISSIIEKQTNRESSLTTLSPLCLSLSLSHTHIHTHTHTLSRFPSQFLPSSLVTHLSVFLSLSISLSLFIFVLPHLLCLSPPSHSYNVVSLAMSLLHLFVSPSAIFSHSPPLSSSISFSFPPPLVSLYLSYSIPPFLCLSLSLSTSHTHTHTESLKRLTNSSSAYFIFRRRIFHFPKIQHLFSTTPCHPKSHESFFFLLNMDSIHLFLPLRRKKIWI